jgi:anti-sigma factor RsiW
MSECPNESRLSAYHDRELDAGTSQLIESHLAGCNSCSNTLRGIVAVSTLLGATPNGRMSQMGLARLHETASSAAATIAAQRARFPMIKAMMTIAASILVIAGAWLVEIPSTKPAVTGIVQQPVRMEPWENVALGGGRDIPTDIQRQTGTARADFSSFVLRDLQARKVQR